LALAASCQEEKDKWLEDLFEAINVARERNDGKLLQYLSLKSSSKLNEKKNIYRGFMSSVKQLIPQNSCCHIFKLFLS